MGKFQDVIIVEDVLDHQLHGLRDLVVAGGSHWRLEDVELCYGVVEYADLKAGEPNALAVSDSLLQQTFFI